MGKPGKKWIIIFNVVMDLVMAVILSISAILLAHQKIALYPNLTAGIALSFVFAFAVSMIVPIHKIEVGFPGLLHIKPHTLTEKLVGIIPVSLIFTVIVGGALTFLNLYLAHQTEQFPRTYLGSFLPMFLIVYAVVFIMTPVSAAIANNACRK